MITSVVPYLFAEAARRDYEGALAEFGPAHTLFYCAPDPGAPAEQIVQAPVGGKDYGIRPIA